MLVHGRAVLTPGADDVSYEVPMESAAPPFVQMCRDSATRPKTDRQQGKATVGSIKSKVQTREALGSMHDDCGSSEAAVHTKMLDMTSGANNCSPGKWRTRWSVSAYTANKGARWALFAAGLLSANPVYVNMQRPSQKCR